MKTIIVCLFILVIAVATGCDPVKRAARQQRQSDAIIQNYIAAHPPRIDTNTVYLPGKIVIKPYPVLVADTNRMQQAKDSLQTALSKKYSTALEDCNRQINDAFNTGYEAAVYQYSKEAMPVRVDSFIRTIYNTDAVNSLAKENANLNGRIATLQEERKHDTNWMWWFIGSAVLNVFAVAWMIKQAVKPKLKLT